MSSIERPLDAAGHQGSPVTMAGYHQGRPPKYKGRSFPADPPPVEEIIARHARHQQQRRRRPTASADPRA